MEGNGKKRRREDSSFAKAYDGVTFTPRTATGRPGTPHRYFRESYTVTFDNNDDKDSSSSGPAVCQVVHCHVNGLVVVTAGTSTTITSQDADTLEAIDFHVQVADVAKQSAATKRKQKAKMLKGKKVDDSVNPMDHLATIKFQNNDKETKLRCCVWGSVIEINPNLTPTLLREDPLLDGYLAVILPSGPFPPRPLGGEGSSEEKPMAESTTNAATTSGSSRALETTEGLEK